MYKVCKGIQQGGREFLAIINCNFTIEKLYNFYLIGDYAISKNTLINIYVNGNNKYIEIKAIKIEPLSYNELLELINVFNNINVGVFDKLYFYYPVKNDVIEGNSFTCYKKMKSDLMDRLFNALLFYEDYIDFGI